MNAVKFRLFTAACLCAFSVGTLQAQSPEDDKLQAFYKDYLEQNFVLQPVAATALGDHRFDAKMDDISPEARARWHDLTQRTLDALPKQVDYAHLSRDGQIDFEILKNDLTDQLWAETNLRVFETDPRTYGGYLNDSVYLLVAVSTAPKETNVANAIARMEEMPRIIEEAKRSLTHPVRPILETAIRQNLGALSYYENDLFNYTGETPQQEKLKTAAAKVAAEWRDYQTFLEGSARERAEDNWRLGQEKFDQKFELETGVGITAEQNLTDAENEFTRERNELYVVARQLWPRYFPGQTIPPDDEIGRREVVTKVIGAVNQEHGTAEETLGKIRAAVERVKAFICQRDYLRLPDPDRCDVIEMPEFKRGNSLAYLDNAPPLDPQAKASMLATYLLHTFGELCVSPVGLSSVTKLAPPRLAGQMMGVWFLATSLGNLLAGLLAGSFAPDQIGSWHALYLKIIILPTVAGLLLIVCARPLKHLAGDIR